MGQVQVGDHTLPDMDDLKAIQDVLPLTSPLPPLLSTVPSSALAVESSLARNADHLPRWQAYLTQLHSEAEEAIRASRGTVSGETVLLLGPNLAGKESRRSFQRLVETYERCLANFPTSYKMWKQYLDMRKLYVLGAARRQVKLSAPKRKPSEDQVCPDHSVA